MDKLNASIKQYAKSWVHIGINWDKYINVALFAYRTSHHEARGRTQFELLYDRDARLPKELDMHADMLTDWNKPNVKRKQTNSKWNR